MQTGKLYLIPTLLGETTPDKVLPDFTLRTIGQIKCFIVEEVKTARRFLKQAGYPGSLDQIRFLVYNEHSPETDLSIYMKSLLEGLDTGLLSEAGMPCIADPGSTIVALAHRCHIPVIPLAGPSSIPLALMASGFNGQHFVFHGYLPISKEGRRQKISEMETSAIRKGQTQIFMETPYRNQALFDTLIQNCHPGTRICLAIALTTAVEQIRINTVRDWRKARWIVPRKPTIFLLSR